MRDGENRCSFSGNRLRDRLSTSTTTHTRCILGIPFIDLKAQYRRIESDIKAGIDAVLEHGKYIMGPEIKQFEAEAAQYIGAKHALSCGSGTDALMLALMALGIGQGDAVFCPPFTFMATAETIALTGATPVFVDIDPVTFNMDPDKLEAAVADLKIARPELTPKAIMPVDLFGLSCDYDSILAIAGKAGLKVIVDGAQSFGAEYKGTKTAALGDVACTSFFPAKPLGAYGDGGMCFTDSDEINEIMASIRVHGGGTHKYDNVRLGMNARMDTLQVAILRTKLSIFPDEVEARQKVAYRYAEKLAGSGLVTPTVPEGCLSVWAQYSVLAESGEHRDALQAKCKNVGVPTAIYYPLPLHLQQAYSYLGYKAGDMPVSEDAGSRIFALPMHPYMSETDQDAVCAALTS